MNYGLNSIKAVIFDMDGTLTLPHIDWKVLRSRIGVPDGSGIIDHIVSLPSDEARAAETIVREVEMEAAKAAVPNPGTNELFERLYRLPLKLALVTNNHDEAMRLIIHTLGLRFDVSLSREDATLKPAPDLMLLALDRLELTADEVVSVGDGRYDRIASGAAGIRFIHFSHDRNLGVESEGDTIYEIGELCQLLNLYS
ncbi:MAG: HAD family phosphatase [Candidatus Latescibacterota bacterium]|nr:HAD family phosphatase [Candidatus Latescibacterota bacterium]